MRMPEQECWDRLAVGRRAILATLRPDGAVDTVPVVYAVGDRRRIVMPIDTVKAKATASLQRLHNIDADERATLLIDYYDDDWSQLWWARFRGTARTINEEELPAARLLLAARYPQYREPRTIVAAIELAPTDVTGWRQR